MIDRLLDDLKSDNASTCIDAAFKLAEIKDDRAVDGLIEALQDPKPLVRNYAIFALAEIGNPRAMEPIVRMLNDSDIEVRSRAAWALGKIGDRSCMPALAAALKDALEVDAHLCRQLIVALADIGGIEAVASILPAFQSSIPEVRVVAADFLGYIGDDQTREILSDLIQKESNPDVQAALRAAIEYTQTTR